MTPEEHKKKRNVTEEELLNLTQEEIDAIMQAYENDKARPMTYKDYLKL